MMDGLTVAVAMSDGTLTPKAVGYGLSYTGTSGDISIHNCSCCFNMVDNGTAEMTLTLRC